MVDGLSLRSLITEDGRLLLSLDKEHVPEPGPDEVVIRVEAAPLNPTDHYQMTGPADFSTLEQIELDGRPALTMKVPSGAVPYVAARLGQSRVLGSEGAGEVVAAGVDVRGLLGKRVTVNPGGMFAQYRLIKAAACLELPPGVTSAEGAAAFVNPLTVLGFIETARSEGHSAIVHAAAASNLGQMLVRACQADGIQLVNIVRSERQVALLKSLGATHVLDSTQADFTPRLVDALAATGARLAFDPTGGGRMASQILTAMEAAETRSNPGYLIYGTSTPKKVYIYGGLEGGPTILDRSYGFAWDVGGWLLFNFLSRVGAPTVARLKQRVLNELTTTFSSTYTRTISLRDIVDPTIFRAFQARATGEKYLVDPTRP